MNEKQYVNCRDCGEPRGYLNELSARVTTIADEAFGASAVEATDETLSRIERGIFEQRAEAAALRSRLKEAEGLLWELAEPDTFNGVEVCRCGSRVLDHPYFEAPCLQSRARAFLAGSTQGTPADSNGGGR